MYTSLFCSCLLCPISSLVVFVPKQKSTSHYCSLSNNKRGIFENRIQTRPQNQGTRSKKVGHWQTHRKSFNSQVCNCSRKQQRYLGFQQQTSLVWREEGRRKEKRRMQDDYFNPWVRLCIRVADSMGYISHISHYTHSFNPQKEWCVV